MAMFHFWRDKDSKQNMQRRNKRRERKMGKGIKSLDLSETKNAT